MVTGNDRDALGPPRRVVLPGDRVLLVRPVEAGDADGLRALYQGLSPRDLNFRFFTHHAPPRRFVDHLVSVIERGGYGLVATVGPLEGDRSATAPRIVAEACYELLPDGDGELGITVADDVRGWLGPYLLDALLAEAASRGVANLQADVLVSNRRMLSLLRARGVALMVHDDYPATTRVLISTTGRVPSWPGAHDRPRLLIEMPGGRWRGEETARAAGFDVLVCPGPSRGWARCPALEGKPCPLVEGADVVLDTLPDPEGPPLREARRSLHPTVPVCVELRPSSTHPEDSTHVRSTSPTVAVVGLLQRLSASGDGGTDGAVSDHPGT